MAGRRRRRVPSLLFARHLPDHLTNAVEIAGDQLQRRIPERRAAAIGQRDPAVQIGGLVVAADGEHVVGVPCQVTGEIGRLDPVPRAAVIVERPDQRRTCVEIARQFGKADVVRLKSGDNLAVNLPHRRVVVAEQPRPHFFFLRHPVVLPPAHQRDVTADILAQQLLGFEQVVLVVLLEDPDPSGLRERPEMHGRGIHRGRDVLELEIGHAFGQLNRADVAHEREIRVIDRDGELDLVVERRQVLAGGGRRRGVRITWSRRTAGGTGEQLHRRPEAKQSIQKRAAMGAPLLDLAARRRPDWSFRGCCS